MKFLRFWFPVGLYSGIIFCVSSIPNLSAPISQCSFDKVVHVVEYSILGFFCARALSNTTTWPNKALVWIVISFCFLYGTGDEFHQSFVMGRIAEWGDVLADTIGGSIGVLIYPFLRRRRYS